MDEKRKRIEVLSKEQLVIFLGEYDQKVGNLTRLFTFTATGQVYGDKSEITDAMLIELQYLSNILWHEIMDIEIDAISNEESTR